MPGLQRRAGIHLAQSSVTLSVMAVDQASLEICITRPCERADAGHVLAELVSQHNLKDLPAYVTLSRSDYDTQFVDLPGVGEDELREALPWRVTPPGVLSNDEIVTTGVRLSNDREVGGDEPTLVRATVMSQNMLQQLSEAVTESGLDLRAVFPRETALITLAKQGVEDIGLDAEDPAETLPIMTIFVARRSTGIAVARGDQLYLSRTVNMTIDRETGLTDAQTDQLVSECVRTATNFNKRLSDTPLSQCLIGPDVPGMDAARDALSDALNIDCQILALPPHVEPADESTRSVAATPEGMLAVAGTLNVALPDSASIYQPPAKDRSLTSPAKLTMATVLGLVSLGLISGGQAYLIASTNDSLQSLERKRDEQQQKVATLQQTLEERKDTNPSASLVERRNTLERRYAAYERMFNAFQSIDVSLGDGFAAPLQALGQTTAEDVWLRQIAIESDRVVIEGRTLEPFRAETFAARVGETAALSGWSPQSVDIDNRRELSEGLVVHDFVIRGEGLVANSMASRDNDLEVADSDTELRALLREMNTNQ